MDTNEISYCLAKQISTMHAIATNYGYIELDEAMQEAVENALRPLLEKRLEEQSRIVQEINEWEQYET
jgi:hypothetical protein